MELREAKAAELADRGRVVRQGNGWTVFSLTCSNTYKVTLEPNTECSCEDFALRHEPCKHILAARITRSREDCGIEFTPDTQTPPIQFPKKPTYKQDWPNYNAAQAHEKEHFLDLLVDLCRMIEEPLPEKRGRGRPKHSLADAVFGVAYKVYSGFSARRFATDLQDAHERGCISKPMSYGSVFDYMEDPRLMPILKKLIVLSSLPLKAIDTNFAADSSGFTGCRFVRWYDHKYGREMAKCDWVKVHVMTGTTTHVITAVEVLERDAGDSPQFKPLLSKTAENFTVKEASGDKAYCNLENYQAVADVGGQGFFAFKVNATGGVGGLYEQAFHYFSLRKEEFLRHYHLRSNVESVFSAVKRLFGDSVRSKTSAAMANEALAKLLCYNITILIHAMYELGINPVFWGDGKPEEEPTILRLVRPG